MSYTVTLTAKRRKATIDRAATYLETTDRATVLHVLADTTLYEHVKEAPEQLAADLRAVDPANTGSFFGHWKAAQQTLQAAGLPYNPTDTDDITVRLPLPVIRRLIEAYLMDVQSLAMRLRDGSAHDVAGYGEAIYRLTKCVDLVLGELEGGEAKTVFMPTCGVVLGRSLTLRILHEALNERGFLQGKDRERVQDAFEKIEKVDLSS